MPNECYNDIQVFGDLAEIERMLLFVRSKKKRNFDFNTILPYPEKYAKLDKQAKFEKKIGNPDFENGWNHGGYEWCIGYWGVSTNAWDIDIDYSYNEDGTKNEFQAISFTTAWAPSLPVTKALSKIFPELTFNHRYDEGNMNFSGYVMYKNGKVLEKKKGNYKKYSLFESESEDGEVNNLDELPFGIDQTENFTELTITNNNLANFQSVIGKMKNLKCIHISGLQKLSSLIPEIINLSHIEEIEIYCPDVETLPAEIGYLPNLKKLNLSFCTNLTHLPAEIGHLTNLEYLNLRLCYNLIQIPSEIGLLVNLKELDISGCGKAQIPPEICALLNLENLKINCGTFTDLPREISQLSNLLQLEVCINWSAIPVEVFHLSNLEYLDIDGFQPTHLPSEIGNLSNLKTLTIGSNINEIPPEIGNLHNLTELVINSELISSIPPEIGRLTNLIKLGLMCQNVMKLPDEIANLGQLDFFKYELNLNKKLLTPLVQEFLERYVYISKEA